jgi:hypothetical protein
MGRSSFIWGNLQKKSCFFVLLSILSCSPNQGVLAPGEQPVVRASDDLDELVLTGASLPPARAPALLILGAKPSSGEEALALSGVKVLTLEAPHQLTLRQLDDLSRTPSPKKADLASSISSSSLKRGELSPLGSKGSAESLDGADSARSLSPLVHETVSENSLAALAINDRISRSTTNSSAVEINLLSAPTWKEGEALLDPKDLSYVIVPNSMKLGKEIGPPFVEISKSPDFTILKRMPVVRSPTPLIKDPTKALRISDADLERFVVSAAGGQLRAKMPGAAELNPGTIRPITELVTEKTNWKFVLVEGSDGKPLMRAGEKSDASLVVPEGVKQSLHHPSLAGLDSSGTFKSVSTAGIVQVVGSGVPKKVGIQVDSGNYGLDAIPPTQRHLHQEIISSYLDDQQIPHHFEDGWIILD